MSKDNPAPRPEKADKLDPVTPAAGSGETGPTWQRHETRSRGQLARDVTSRPPIRRFDDAAPGEGVNGQPPEHGGRPPGGDLPGSGRKLHETRSRAELARDVMSRPPIRRLEPADPPASQDTSPRPGGQVPGSGNPADAPIPQGDGKRGITHWHAEFHGQRSDLYTDGNRWVSGDAVRAAQAESQVKPEAARPRGITGLPTMRDHGDNTVGDTDNEPQRGEQLLEHDDKELPRPERLRKAIDRDFGDFADSVKNTASTVKELGELPPSGAGQSACPVIPPRGPEITPMPYQSPDVGSIAQLGVVVGVVGWHAYNKTRDLVSETADKISEWRSNPDARD